MHHDPDMLQRFLSKGKTEKQTQIMVYLLMKAVHTRQLLHSSSIPPPVLITDQAQLFVIIL